MLAAVRFSVTGLDLDDEPTVQLLGEHLADLAWGTSDGCVTMTAFVDPDRPVDAAIDACRRLEQTVPGARAIRVDEELVSTSDIGHRAGVSREGVRKWSSDPTFPVPRGSVGGGSRGSTKVWSWADVARWVDDHRGLDVDEAFIDGRSVAEINARLAEAPRAMSSRWSAISAPSNVVVFAAQRRPRPAALAMSGSVTVVRVGPPDSALRYA